MLSPSAYVLLYLITLLVAAETPLAAPDHFILTRISSLAFARIDPIVNPGKISGHVHNIMGGSCFNENINTPEQQQNCDCSSVIIGDDMSNYWAPALYYQDKDNKFSPILNGNRVYYFTKGRNVKPFPSGLRMISGLATRRDAADKKSLGVKISCNHGKQTQFLPNGTSHPDGCESIAMGIFFPSCGLASGDLDSPDHFSHLTWPQARPGGGAQPFDDPNGAFCPESHPIKYPTIFMEAHYYLTNEQPWHSGNPLILSNGDQSGLAYHADFFEGWRNNVLKDAIAQCGDGNGVGDQLAQCPPLAKSMSEQATWSCRVQNRIPNEDVGFYKPIDALPGCNKIWPTDGPDTKPPCKEENPPELIYPNAQFVNLQYRERVPMLFTLAKDLSNRWEMNNYIPDLGLPGASSIKPWGWDASNKASLKVSTVQEILGSSQRQAPGNASSLAAQGGSSGVSGSSVPAGSGSKSAAAASSSKAAASKSSAAKSSAAKSFASKSTAKTPVASPVKSAASPPPALAVNPNAGKACSRKKRNLAQKIGSVTDDIRAHRERRAHRRGRHGR